MKGNMNWQVKEILKRSGLVKIGASKHAAKALARNACKAMNEPTSSRNIAKHMGMHSIQTVNTYLGVWLELSKHAKTHFKLRDITQMNPAHVQHFLETKIDSGVKLKSFRTTAAACEKLALALELTSIRFNNHKTYNFSPTIQKARETASQLLDGRTHSRCYHSPGALIRNLKSPVHQLAALTQYQSGVRVGDIVRIEAKQLLGLSHDPLSGTIRGRIYISQSKGGKSGEILVHKSTFNQLKHILEKGDFAIKLNEYRADLKQAAAASDQLYHSTHGLRWSFAQNRFREVQEKGGAGFDKALEIVSQEMFHKRAHITKHYLM